VATPTSDRDQKTANSAPNAMSSGSAHAATCIVIAEFFFNVAGLLAACGKIQAKRNDKPNARLTVSLSAGITEQDSDQECSGITLKLIISQRFAAWACRSSPSARQLEHVQTRLRRPV